MLDEHALPAAKRDLATARPFDLIVLGCTSAGALREATTTTSCAHASASCPGRPPSAWTPRSGRRSARWRRRVGVVTPHVIALNRPIRESPEADGVEVARIDGLGIADNFEIAMVPAARICDFAERTLHGSHRSGVRVVHQPPGLLGPAGAGATPGPPRGHQQPGGHRRGARAPGRAAPAGRGGVSDGSGLPGYECVPLRGGRPSAATAGRGRQGHRRRPEPGPDAQPGWPGRRGWSTSTWSAPVRSRTTAGTCACPHSPGTTPSKSPTWCGGAARSWPRRQRESATSAPERRHHRRQPRPRRPGRRAALAWRSRWARRSPPGRDGARDVAAGDLLVSYLTTTLEPDEAVAEVRVPTSAAAAGRSWR